MMKKRDFLTGSAILASLFGAAAAHGDLIIHQSDLPSGQDAASIALFDGDLSAIEGHGGTWCVHGEDIFGGPVSIISLLPGNSGNHPKYGDFGFAAIEVAQVPAPGSLALLCAAAIGIRPRRIRA